MFDRSNWQESAIWEVVGGKRQSGPEVPPRMPKKGPPLAEKELQILELWLAKGAVWPEGFQLNSPDAEVGWWSLQPLPERRVFATAGVGWNRNWVDGAIREKAGSQIAPAPEASRAVLIRRLTFDLTGLPPKPEDVAEFQEDEDPIAYWKLVDRLLASPALGERRARQWLDIVHFGESDDFGRDYLRPNAWPYRDWVVSAWNADMPYQRFVAMQVAGDALWPDDPGAATAVGFLAAGPWDYTGHVLLFDDAKEKEQARYLDRDDMVGTTFNTFTSQTVQCARCHDHKFDPISQSEYYGMQAVFAGSNRTDRPRDARLRFDPRFEWWRLPLVASGFGVLLVVPLILFSRRRKAGWTRWLLRCVALGLVLSVATVWWVWGANVRDLPYRVEQRIARNSKWLASFLRNSNYDAAPKVYSIESTFPRQESKTGNYLPAAGSGLRSVHLLFRGNVEQPRDLALPGALGSIAGMPAKLEVESPDGDGPRRAALARWLTDDTNPLIWRTMANRMWQFHFGIGIVDTPNDFGHMGSRPSHLELLDELARTLRDSDGSLKELSREIVLSATYRQSAHPPLAHNDIDAQNRLLWAGPTRRLDAESVRDAMLAVSGGLNRQMGGPSFRTFVLEDESANIMQFDYESVDLTSADQHRRSVYRFLARSAPDPFFEALDCPSPSQAVPLRAETNTALQALAMLNDQQVLALADELAHRIERDVAAETDQVQHAVWLTLQRPATSTELRILEELRTTQGLATVCRVLFNSNSFHFVD